MSIFFYLCLLFPFSSIKWVIAEVVHNTFDLSSRTSHAAHYHFNLVFGSERVNLHFSSPEDLELAVNAQKQLEEVEKFPHRLLSEQQQAISPHLTCVLYSSGYKAKTIMSLLFGSDAVSTVHVSETDNRVCFLVATTHQRLQESLVAGALRGGKDASSLAEIDFILWTHIPAPLRLHQSTLHYLGLLDDQHPHYKQSQTSILKRPSPSAIDLAKTQLVVTTIAGSSTDESRRLSVQEESVERSDSVAQFVQKIANQLRHSNPEIHLESMLKMYDNERSGHIWHQAAAELSGASSSRTTSGRGAGDVDKERENTQKEISCPFHLLKTDVVESDVIISGLDAFQKQSVFPASCLTSLLALLASDSQVIDIRLRHSKTVFNKYVKSILQSNVYDQGFDHYPYTTAGLDGTGQVIGIGDSGIDELSCFFNEADYSLMERSSYKSPVTNLGRRKVVQYVEFEGKGGDTPHGHGTHVSGTAAGSVLVDSASPPGAADMRVHEGHAPNAKIAFFDMSKDGHSISYPSPLAKNVFGPAYGAGARLHSNSWGGPFNFYDSDTISVDKFHVDHSDFLALFAAGNDGADGYYSVSDPAVSKNSLTVGASMTNKTIDRVAFFSSLGPTFDQRIKPDVLAPGYFTSSACAGDGANRTCEIVRHAGTSMATPAVAGVAALVRQYFEDSSRGFTPYQRVCRPAYPLCAQAFSPRGATVKAVVIHSGEAMKEYYTGKYNTTEPSAPLLNAPPDFYQGFGRVSLPNVLPFPDIEDVLDLYVEELEVESLQEILYDVVVRDASRPLKVTVVWMDPANHIIQSKLLLHDIDLEVIDANGVVFFGNNQPGDEMNNVEQVFISSPVVDSTYQVRIQAKSFTESSHQKFSLVITSGAGIVNNKRTEMSTPSVAYNSLKCAANEQMITIRKSDRGGDGWEGGFYSIVDETSHQVVINGSMSSSASRDIISYDYLCLEFGTYNITLHPTNSNSSQGQGLESSYSSSLLQMGVAIDLCHVYLSAYQTSALLNVSSLNNCNSCLANDHGYFSFEVILVGSFYGVPYGWKGASKYTLAAGDDSVVVEGTLVVGMLEERAVCLPTNMKYVLRLNNVPDTDDFFDDDYLEKHLGTAEYRIGVRGCENTKQTSESREINVEAPSQELLLVKSGGTIHIDILESGSCEMYVGSSPTDSEKIQLPWYFELVVTLLASLCCGFMIIACLFCRGFRVKKEDALLLLEQEQLSNQIEMKSSNFQVDEEYEDSDRKDEGFAQKLSSVSLSNIAVNSLGKGRKQKYTKI